MIMPKSIRTFIQRILSAFFCSLLTVLPPINQLEWNRFIPPTNNKQVKFVALTFDDGPHPVFTPQILEILDEYNIKATFFMVGHRMEKYPEIVKQVIARGHKIGNHSYFHPENLQTMPEIQIVLELEKCNLIYRKITGNNMVLFRPPYGHISERLRTVAFRYNYRLFLWSVCADNRHTPTPQMMMDRVLNKVNPGAIILIHDGGDFRWRDVPATRLIIENLIKQKYRFVTLE